MKDQTRYWKTIVDTMADGLMIVDARGTIQSINNALEALTGYSKEEIAGKTCRVFNCDKCEVTRSSGGKHYCALFKEGKIRRCRCVIQRKDGSQVNILKNASVLRDTEGRIIGGVETLSDLSETIAKESIISDLRNALSRQEGFYGMIGNSPAMRQVYSLITSAAQSDAPVVIYGESGTGKELVAQAIHDGSPRKDGPFIKVNCAALNESLLESELFGHVKGAFTGADRNRIGRFEAAGMGSIFLDEIGEIPLSTQVKLLRVLQEKEIERVGDNRTIPIDVRIISATHKDLTRLSRQEKFREDLYYRINVIPFFLAPLRKRREDIPLLINYFMNRIGLKTGKPVSGMSQEAADRLTRYPWPGNVRELINVIEYAFVVCPGGVITPSHFPPNILPEAPARTASPPPAPAVLRPKLTQTDGKQRLLNALDEAGGNKSQAARLLGISRVGLYKQLRRYGIQVEKKIRA